MFVFISDLWLDRPEVMARLKTLFLGYSKMPPTAFIFMGNFMGSTSEIGPQKSKVFKELFKSLGDLMLEREHRPLLENSKFVFVPGPNDPGFANIFPRPPLPNSLVQDLVSRIEPQFPNAVVMASNPCRIQFCTQEMVIFRLVIQFLPDSHFIKILEKNCTNFSGKTLCQKCAETAFIIRNKVKCPPILPKLF